MFFCEAYGFGIRSYRALPGFNVAHSGEYEVSVSESAYFPSPPVVDEKVVVSDNGDGLVICWPEVASYNIEDANKIVITPHSLSVEFSNLILQPLYAIVMATLLKQMGFSVFHASSVTIMNKGVMLVGDKGFGKSTITAALVTKGHKFLTDDVTAVSIVPEGKPIIPLGIPRIKLWYDAMRAIGLNLEKFPLISPILPKHAVNIQSNQLAQHNSPLCNIVILERGNTVTIQQLTESEKLFHLLSNQYFAKYHTALSKEEYTTLLDCCSLLLQQVQIHKICSPQTTDAIPRIISSLELLVSA